MDKTELQKLTGNDALTVAEAMQKIDNNSNGILFLLNQNNILIGCVTDGDIRRFLLRGGKLSDQAICAANRFPKTAGTINEARQLYHKRNCIRAVLRRG